VQNLPADFACYHRRTTLLAQQKVVFIDTVFPLKVIFAQYFISADWLALGTKAQTT